MRKDVPQIYHHIKLYQPPNKYKVKFSVMAEYTNPAQRDELLQNCIDRFQTFKPAAGWNWELDKHGNRHQHLFNPAMKWDLNPYKSQWEWMFKVPQQQNQNAPHREVIIACVPANTKQTLYFKGLFWTTARRGAMRFPLPDASLMVDDLKRISGVNRMSVYTTESIHMVPVKKYSHE